MMDKNKFNMLLKKLCTSKEAYTKIYEFYFHKIVFHISWKFDRNIAEDIAQEFFVKLFKIEATEEILYPTSWIYSICDNIALTYMKKFKTYDQLDGQEIYDYIPKNDENEDLTEALEQLNDMDRKILFLFYWEGYSLNEISSIIDCKYEVIRKKHSRSLKKLKKLLK